MNIQRASVHYKKLDLKIKKRFTDFPKFGNSFGNQILNLNRHGTHPVCTSNGSNLLRFGTDEEQNS